MLPCRAPIRLSLYRSAPLFLFDKLECGYFGKLSKYFIISDFSASLKDNHSTTLETILFQNMLHSIIWKISIHSNIMNIPFSAILFN